MLEAQIEKALSETFNYSSRVVVISYQQLKAVVEKHLPNLAYTPKPTNTMYSSAVDYAGEKGLLENVVVCK